MSRSAGTGQPVYLKCSWCKRQGRSGRLVRTGRMRKYHRRGCGVFGRYLDMSYQCECLDCGHCGFYAHRDVLRKPLRVVA